MEDSSHGQASRDEMNRCALVGDMFCICGYLPSTESDLTNHLNMNKQKHIAMKRDVSTEQVFLLAQVGLCPLSPTNFKL